MIEANAVEALGAYLNLLETEKLIKSLEAGNSPRKSLDLMSPIRRTEIKSLLQNACLYKGEDKQLITILKAILGAKQNRTPLTPVWSMPGYLAKNTEITAGAQTMVKNALTSVMCATYNFGDTSVMQSALKEASVKNNINITIYVDGKVGNPNKVKEQIPLATVFGSGNNHKNIHIKSHSKFIVVDHRYVYISSANFSFSAENFNVEMGLKIDDAVLAESIEKEMRGLEGIVYHPAR